MVIVENETGQMCVNTGNIRRIEFPGDSGRKEVY